MDGPILGLELVEPVLGEVVLDSVAAFDLFPEYVLLVEEEDKVRVQKETGGPDLVEEVDRFAQLVAPVLVVDGVKTGAVDEEHNGRDPIEHLDPLSAFAALAADVEHAKCLLNACARLDGQIHLEFELLDVAGLPPTLQDVIVVWNIVDVSDFVHTVQEAVGRLVGWQYKLVGLAN